MTLAAGKIRYWVLVILVSMLGSWALTELPVTSVLLDSLNQRLYDTILIITANNNKQDTYNDITIVDIDEKSIQTLGQFSTWPNLYFADALNYIETGKPAAVGFDIFFTEPDTMHSFAIRRLSEYLQQKAALDRSTTARVLSHLSTDSLFADAVYQGGNVFMAMFNQGGEATKSVLLPPVLKAWNIKPQISLAVNAPVPPIPILANSAYGIGFAHVEPNRTGVVHDYPLFFEYQGKYYANFGFQICLDLLGVDELRQIDDYICLYQNKRQISRLPLDKEGRYMLNFYGPHKTFRTIAFSDILFQRIPAEFFNNKVILFGSSATGLYDLKAIPFDAQYPGVELHATFIRNVLNNDFIHTVPNLLHYIVVLLLVSLMILITRKFAPLAAFLLYLGLLFVSLLAFVLIYYYLHYTLNYFAFLLPWNIGFFLSVFLQYSLQLKEKRHLRYAFEHFVAKDVVKEIIDNPAQLKVGGKQSEVSVLISDVRDFTQICENSTPDDIVNLLNDYFNRITPCVIQTHGMLDKYIGDAMVALYNVPIPCKNYTSEACSAALKIIHIAEDIKRENANHPIYKVFRNGIGITTGSLIVGNMGSDHIFNYTGIGDIMNLAARLEGLNKYYGTRIIIDHNTYATVKDRFVIRLLDCVAVKGQQDCTFIYELVCEKPAISAQAGVRTTPPEMQKIGLYEAAYADFKRGDWQTALDKFQDILKTYPDDNPTRMMIARITERGNKAPDDYQGVWYYTEK